MSTKIVFDSNKGRRVPYNEYSIDVSHMTENRKDTMLSLLRSGSDLDGNPRRVVGVKRRDDGSMDIDMFSPSADSTGKLV